MKVSMSSAGEWLRTHLGGPNLVAGLAVGAYLIPQAMAYGQLAGVGVALGLGVAAIPLVLYPLIGRHTWLSMGPESAVALMAAATVAPLAVLTGMDPVSLLGVLAITAGVILLAAWAMRASVVTDLLSKPVLIGYLTGVAVLMIVSQIGNLLGSPIDATNLLTAARSLGSVVVNGWALLVGCLTIAVIVVLRRLWPRLPGILVAIVLAIPAGFFLPVAIVDDIEMSVPTPRLPMIDMEFLLPLLIGAAAIAMVSYTDVIVTARAFSDGTKVHPQRELAALGIGQVAVGAFGGYPVSVSSSRTAIARDSGATSRFYSWNVAIVAIVAPLVFGYFLAHIPKAALAGVVIVAAFALIDVRGWSELARLRIAEVVVAGACAAGVLLLGILPGVLMAVALSIAELLIRLSRPHDGILGVVPGLAGMHDIDDYPDAQTIPGLVVFRYDAPLFFANANDFYSACMEAADTPGCKWLLLNVESNVEVDSTGLDALRELHDDLLRDGKRLALARVKHDLMVPLEKYGLVEVIGPENLFATLPVAVEAFHEWQASGRTPTEPKDLRGISPVHRFARSERGRKPLERDEPSR